MSDFQRELPDWIEGFMALTDNSEPPTLFKKWSAISAIASALQRKVRVELGISLTFYPNFYIVLVGPSATGKGLAMSFASDIITQIPSIRLAAEATSLQSLIRRMKEVNLTDIEIDTGKQVYHSSMTIFSEEFTVFLGYHNRELITALCNWYDCRDKWTYDTIKRDKETVHGVWVNLIGGTTPENIRDAFPIEAFGAGLPSRIIFIYEEKPGKFVPLPFPTAEEIELQMMLVRDLEKISLMSGQFRFTEDFISSYADWAAEARANPPFQDPKFDGYCGRRRRHLFCLSMVCSASRDNELILTVDDLQRAASLLAEAEIKMGLTFKGMGKSDISDLIHAATVYIQNSEIPEIPMWQFARRFEGDMDKDMLNRILSTLEIARHIDIIHRPGAETIIKILGKRDGI